jgi:RND superfamily putative drug exporter
MFEKLGRTLFRRRKGVLAGFIVATIAAGVIGSLVFARLEGGGYSDPNSDSSKAATYLTDTFKVKDPAIIFIIDAGKSVADPAVAAEVAPIEADLRARSGVANTLSYWSAGGAKQLVSEDGNAAYLFIYGTEADLTSLDKLAAELQKKYDGEVGNLRIYVGGFSTFNNAINERISSDLKFAEAISIPLTFILLTLVFGALAASAILYHAADLHIPVMCPEGVGFAEEIKNYNVGFVYKDLSAYSDFPTTLQKIREIKDTDYIRYNQARDDKNKNFLFN